MNAIKHLFSHDFLFYINRVSIERSDRLFALISIAFIVAAIVFKVWGRVHKHPVTKALLKRFFQLAASLGIFGALWYGARLQTVTFFGSHFMFLLGMLAGFIWFLFIVRYMWKQYRAEKQAWDKQQLKQKYL